jgi:hypothetical protein
MVLLKKSHRLAIIGGVRSQNGIKLLTYPWLMEPEEMLRGSMRGGQ